MVGNVIRQDVIQLDFDFDLSSLKKVNKTMDDLKKSITGVGNDDGLDNLKNDADKTKNSVGGLGKEADKAKNSVTGLSKVNMTKLSDGLSKVDEKISNVAKKAAGAAYTGLKKIAGISFKALVAGVGAVGTAMGVAVKGYSDYEQLVGGMSTLLGARETKSVQEYAKLVGKSVDSIKDEYQKLRDNENLIAKNANNAYKTAGMSANQYMETITSFSAALKNSLGGDAVEAAKLADVAIQDMGDNVNKMGSDMESVTVVYSSLARGIYTTLDNLKLGYAGTKEGAKQLVNDAAKLDKSVKANDLSYANLVKAIHAVQVETGIYGTTQREAEKTIAGSLNSMKAAWQNLMPALVQGGDRLDQCIENLVDSTKTFAGNIMPVVKKSLSGVGSLIEKLSPIIAKELPSLINSLLPSLIKSAFNLIKGLASAVPKMIPTLVTSVAQAIYTGFTGKEMSGDMFATLKSKVNEAFTAIKNIIQGVLSFGKSLMSALAPVLVFIGNLLLNVFSWLGNNITPVLKVVTGLVAAFLAYKAVLIAVKTVTTIVTAVQTVMGVVCGTASATAAAGTTAVGTAAAVSAPQILAFAAAILAAGVAILAICVGVALLVQSAIALANAGWGAVAALAGLVVIVVGFAAGMAFLAPMLTAGAVGMLALGASVLMVGAGFALLGAGALMAAQGLSLISATLPVLTLYGGSGALAIAQLGAGLLVFAAGAVVAGAAALVLAAGLVPLVAEIVILTASTALFAVSMLLITVSMAAITAMMSGFVSALSALPALLMALVPQITAFGLIMTPLVAIIAAVLIPFTAFTALVAVLTASFTVLAITSALVVVTFSAISALLTGIILLLTAINVLLLLTSATFAIVAVSSAVFVAALVPLTAEFVALSATTIALLAATTGLVVTTTALSVIFMQMAVVSLVLTASFVKLGKHAQTLATALLPLTASLIAMSVPLTATSAKFVVFASSLMIALSSALMMNVAFLTMVKSLGLVTALLTVLLLALRNIATTFKQASTVPNIFNVAIKNMVTNATTSTKMLVQVLRTFSASSHSIITGISNDITNIVNKNIADVVKKVTDLPKKMSDGIKSSGKSLANALVEVWTNAVKASIAPVNKVIDGANWIMKQFGSDKRVASWQPYAKGTDGHKGGNALVNDGRGAELVQMPNGNTFIPRGRNVFLPNAPKGMKVLPAEQTARLMGKKSPTFRYADGTGDFDIWESIDNPQGLVGKIRDGVSYDNTSGLGTYIAKGMVTTVTGEMSAWVKKMFDEFGAMSIANYVASKGVEQWRSTVIRALKMEGQYSEANVKRTLYQMQTESGGNPRAINLWDSNAKKGIPSKGLMQVIDPTFRQYARAGFDKNIYDPLSNILASIRYAVARYGSLARAYQGHGYANGGIARKPSVFGEDGAEMAIPLSASKRERGINLWTKTGEMLGMSTYTPENSSYPSSSKTNNTENNTYSPVFNLTINGSDGDDRTMYRKFKRWFDEAMEEMFTSMDNKSPKLREV